MFVYSVCVMEPSSWRSSKASSFFSIVVISLSSFERTTVPRVGGACVLFLKFARTHPPTRTAKKLLDFFSYLLGYCFLAHIGLGTYSAAFGAAKVVVSFLSLGGYHAITLATTEHAAVTVRLQFGCASSARLASHDALYRIKSFLVIIGSWTPS